MQQFVDAPDVSSEQSNAGAVSMALEPNTVWTKPSFESFPLSGALSGRSLLRPSDFIPHFGLSA